MSYKLKLKLREDEPSISIKGRLLKELQTMPELQAVQIIQNTIREIEVTVHDVTWLKRIAFWTPPNGQISQAEDAKWFKLRTKLSELREDVPYNFTLSQFQVDNIWERVTSKEFTAITHIAWVQFLQDFQSVTKKAFTSPDPTDLDDMLVEYEEEEDGSE